MYLGSDGFTGVSCVHAYLYRRQGVQSVRGFRRWFFNAGHTCCTPSGFEAPIMFIHLFLIFEPRKSARPPLVPRASSSARYRHSQRAKLNTRLDTLFEQRNTSRDPVSDDFADRHGRIAVVMRVLK